MTTRYTDKVINFDDPALSESREMMERANRETTVESMSDVYDLIRGSIADILSFPSMHTTSALCSLVSCLLLTLEARSTAAAENPTEFLHKMHEILFFRNDLHGFQISPVKEETSELEQLAELLGVEMPISEVIRAAKEAGVVIEGTDSFEVPVPNQSKAVH